jgi:hypothetical protein
MDEAIGMNPRLPTDDDTNWLFDRAVSWLQEYFGYPAEMAGDLAREHYFSFRDPEYCRRAHVAVHDDDSFHHQGPVELAVRIHYYEGLRADPALRSTWRGGKSIIVSARLGGSSSGMARRDVTMRRLLVVPVLMRS